MVDVVVADCPNWVLVQGGTSTVMMAAIAAQHRKLILTDSGGIQEEAPSLHKPVLVLRETASARKRWRPARLVGTDSARIVTAVRELLADAALYARMASAANPYGDGHAAEPIIDALIRGTTG